MNLFTGAILFLISYEAIMWGWTLNRHASWLKRHPEMDRRRLVSYGMLRVASAMSSLLSIAVWIWWIYLSLEGRPEIHTALHKYVCSIIVCSIQLSHIHFSAMVARYSCLPRSMWPLLSKVASRIVVSISSVEEPPLTSCDVHRCWADMARMKHKDDK